MDYKEGLTQIFSFHAWKIWPNHAISHNETEFLQAMWQKNSFLFFSETCIEKCSDKPLITREVSDTNAMFRRWAVNWNISDMLKNAILNTGNRYGKNTCEWHTGTYEWHTDDIWVHTSDIRVYTSAIGMTYEWHTNDIRVHTSDIRIHSIDIWMTYWYIRVTYEWHTRTYEWHTSSG